MDTQKTANELLVENRTLRLRVEDLTSELRIVAAELTAVQQENIAEGIPPALAINHRLNSVLRTLKG
jgi:hypothetical protein